MTLEEQQHPVQQPPVQQQKQQFKVPDRLLPIMKSFNDVINEPYNKDNLWKFITLYLTFLEKNQDSFGQLFDRKDNENILMSIYNTRNQEIPWSLYNCFITISNRGVVLSQKNDSSDNEKKLVSDVMLTAGIDDDSSPTYSFTSLLQSLQSKDENTIELYNELNNDFIKEFETYKPKPKQPNKSFLNNKVSIPMTSKKLDMKWIILIVVLVVLVVSGIGFYFYKNNNNIYKPPEMKPGGGYISDASSIISN